MPPAPIILSYHFCSELLELRRNLRAEFFGENAPPSATEPLKLPLKYPLKVKDTLALDVITLYNKHHEHSRIMLLNLPSPSNIPSRPFLNSLSSVLSAYANPPQNTHKTRELAGGSREASPSSAVLKAQSWNQHIITKRLYQGFLYGIKGLTATSGSNSGVNTTKLEKDARLRLMYLGMVNCFDYSQAHEVLYERLLDCYKRLKCSLCSLLEPCFISSSIDYRYLTTNISCIFL